MADILSSPKAWGPVFVVGVLMALFYFLINVGAAKSPLANARDLPVAVVNRDAGAEIGGERVVLGAEVVESATTSEKIGDKVGWVRLASRQEALRGIADGRYYGAIVIPEDYSRRIAELLTPPEIPVVSEDAGAEPAQIEVLTNPSAGPFISGTVQTILANIVQGASESTSGRIVGALTQGGALVVPQRAAVIGEPVVARVSDAQPVGANSGRGLMPFFLTFLAAVLGFIGANVVHGNVDALAEGIAVRAGRAPSRARLFIARIILGLPLAFMVGTVEALVAFGIYGAHHEASPLYALLFFTLIASVSLSAALVLLAAFGTRFGILVGSMLVISLGLATSGGTTPVQSLPGYLKVLAITLPFEHATEGVRALLFYGGQLEAGLGAALWVLGAYLGGAILVGGAISLAHDAFSRRRSLVRESGFSPEQETAPSATETSG